MPLVTSIKDAERKVFHTTVNDGLWDIFLGCFFLLFALAPLLSRRLGDFWSSVVFLPFWGLVYLAIRWVRKTIVVPRVGQVHLGPARTARLTRFSYLMLAFNLLALLLGMIAMLTVERFSGLTTSILFGLLMLVAFSLAGYFLDLQRLYLYGLLVGLAPPAGEWLWNRGLAAHHGYPLTFGALAALAFLVGGVLFLRLLRAYPHPNTPTADAL